MQSEPRVGVGAAILDGEGRLLLIKRLTEPEAGCWGLVGGKIDLWETAAQAAAREALEEIGAEVEIGPLLCLLDMMDPDRRWHWLAPVYRARIVSGAPRRMEPEKHGDIGWFALDALPRPLTQAAKGAARALKA